MRVVALFYPLHRWENGNTEELRVLQISWLVNRAEAQTQKPRLGDCKSRCFPTWLLCLALAGVRVASVLFNTINTGICG